MTMSSQLMKSDCKKFSPNIFNKTKCTNCFRQKEEHSAEALESNRVSRKVSKCGYLFVAPGWDFTNPLNRSKRWQRRFFVLYDDGELSYSLDEHPETVPQASIDMNKVLEVADAEEITGHKFSLAITAPDGIHFVKGTSREESRWWSDVLSIYPRSKRHKRNATFPGGQTSSVLSPAQSVRATPSDPRPRMNSCHIESSHHSKTAQWLQSENDLLPTRNVTSPTEIQRKTPSPINVAYQDQPPTSASPPTRDKLQSDDKIRTRRMLNREKRGLKSGRSYSEDFSGISASWKDKKNISETKVPASNSAAHRILLDDLESETRRDEKLKDIADSLTRVRYPRTFSSSYSSSTLGPRPTRDIKYAEDEKLDKSNMPSDTKLQDVDHPDSSGDKLVRGDPDGCGLDISAHRYSPSSEQRVDLPAEELLNIKRGYLMKQDLSKDWIKHWFVLRGTALMYYRDSAAEDKGILDGILDLNGVRNITEITVARNYGFKMETWDGKQYILSAATSGIRANWINAIKKAAGLHESCIIDPNIIVAEKLERELDSSLASSCNMSVCLEREPSIIPTTTSLPPRQSLISSDDEYGTASEGGRKESEDWNESHAPLPPSPPLNRTPISKVKEKARSRGCRRFPRSSSPSSRLSSHDSLGSEILASCGELPESDAEESIGVESVKSSVFDSADSQLNEMDDLKHHFKESSYEFYSADKEYLSLREHKTEVSALEKQIRDLLSALKRTEAQLDLRTRELSELEVLKKRYKKLLDEHENLLSRWRQHMKGPDWQALYQQTEDRLTKESEVWEHKIHSTECALQKSTERCEQLEHELLSSQEMVSHLHNEVVNLTQRLAHGIEENENLYRRLHDMESRSGSISFSSSRERGRSVDSLSDLTNIDMDIDVASMDKDRLLECFEELRGRFEKAVSEIKAMKRELRDSHAHYDDLELVCIALKQESKQREENEKAQASLMVSRIEDLTLKLSAAEKQIRALKQKLSRADTREKRRSLSLKGKESFQICKELEDKLRELEAKICSLEFGKPLVCDEKSSKTSETVRKESDETDATRAAARLRRKSLDSATSSEPMKVLIRLSALESKVAKATEDILSKDVCEPTFITDSPSKSDNPLQNSETSFEKVLFKCNSKVNECLEFVSDIQNKLGCPHNVLLLQKKLLEVKDILDKTYPETNTSNIGVRDTDLEYAKKSVMCVVKKLENFLKSKCLILYKKKKALADAGKLNTEAQMNILAEKLALEAVLIHRLTGAITRSTDNAQLFKNWVVSNEMQNIDRLIKSLKGKLNRSIESALYGCETSIDYLTNVLLNKLIIVGKLCTQSPVTSFQTTECPPTTCIKDSNVQSALLSRKRDLDNFFIEQRNERLDLLAQVLAKETLSCLHDDNEEKKSEACGSGIEDKVLREAWTVAQEAVNHELIQAEISHVIMRVTQMYESHLAAEQEAHFSFVGTQRLILEKWFDSVERILRQEMDCSIALLTKKYEEFVCKIKSGSYKELTSQYYAENIADSRKLLYEFSDLIAHKSLIDARITIACEQLGPFETVEVSEIQSLSEEPKVNDALSTLIDAESALIHQKEQISTICDSDIALGMDFEHLFQLFATKYNSTVDNHFGSFLSNISENLPVSYQSQLIQFFFNMDSEINLLNKLLLESDSAVNTSIPTEICVDKLSSNVTWEQINTLSSKMVEKLTFIRSKVEEDNGCKKCHKLQETLYSLQKSNEEVICSLKLQQAEELAKIRIELEQQKHSLVSQHEAEQAQLKERARLLERRLGTLDSEYTQQVDNLRAAYQALSASLEKDDGEETIRQQYRKEIEQLRAFWEKGLAAMENSHRRVISELEEKHRREMEQLRLEKDQALQEETQATLQALESMRKAHEIEVQKEITKFKAEFIKKMESAHNMDALRKKHEAEMEEIKQEILFLSEKYSTKCLISAQLEEQLNAANKQLNQAQQQIKQLDARNKQLRAHLVSEVSELPAREAVQLLQHESELKKKDEKIDQLQEQLNSAKSHVEELNRLCSHLQCDDKSKLASALQKLASIWPVIETDTKVVKHGRTKSNSLNKDPRSKNKLCQEPSALYNAELITCSKQDYQKCDGKVTFTCPLRAVSPNPLSGMVAEMKKLFES